MPYMYVVNVLRLTKLTNICIVDAVHRFNVKYTY